MDLFGRYMFRQVSGAFLLVLLTLTGIVWLGLALRELDLLTSQGQSIGMFLKITMFALPNLVALIAPHALLLACMHTLDRLNGDSELIVMTGAGAWIWRFFTPLFALTAIVTAVLMVLHLWLMPASMRALRGYVTQVRTDLIAQVLQAGRFSNPDPGLTFHIRDRSNEGELLGLIVHDKRDPKQIMTYLAARGRVLKSGERSYLVMQEGQIHRFLPEKADEGAHIVVFDQYIFDITQFGPKSEVNELKPRERYMSELLYPDLEDPFVKRNIGQLRAEFHNRITGLLFPLLYAMIALVFLGRAKTIRESRWNSILAAFGLSVGLRLVQLAMTNLHILSPTAIFLVYGLPLGAILFAALTAQARMAPYRRSRIGLWRSLRQRLDNNYYWTNWGIRTDKQHGRVG